MSRDTLEWLLIAFGVSLIIFMVRRSNYTIRYTHPKVQAIAKAIATAEGYYVPNSLPRRLNNPGALKDPISGQFRRFDTPEAGWNALYAQVERILNNKSMYYNSNMTIRQIAQIWTGGDKPEAWARIVSSKLGVSPDTPINQVMVA
jgi:hypothetical protein